MSETDPIELHPGAGQGHSLRAPGNGQDVPPRGLVVVFDRHELNLILGLYGRHVAGGEWRDYGIDFRKDCAVFSVFRKASEMPLYRIEKCPLLARRQGIYKVVAMSGLILKRGHDLRTVLRILEPKKSLRAMS